MKRYDLQLIREWQNRYEEEVLKPVLETLENAVGRNIVKFSPKLKKKIKRIAQNYGLKLERLFENTLSTTEKTARHAMMEELDNFVYDHFKVKGGSVVYRKFSGNIYKQIGDHWEAMLDLRSAATRNWLKYVVEDGLTLSDRIWRDVSKFKRVMENTIARNIQMGRSADSLATQMLEFTKQQENIPKKVINYVKNLAPQDAQAAIRKYMKKRMKYNATRVARTEIQRAYRMSYIEQAKKLSFVEGIKWNRSLTEFDCAICDQLANQDLYGLGPGVYPAAEAPVMPHPHCRCHLTSVLKPLKKEE